MPNRWLDFYRESDFSAIEFCPLLVHFPKQEDSPMQTRIQGTTMPVLDVQLDPNESVFSESGELSWMTASIQMTTHTQMGGGGGIFGALKRVAGGGSLFMTEYRASGTAGVVSFVTKVPGHIVPVEIAPGNEYMVHRHGFLCATTQVTIGVGFQQSLGEIGRAH